MQNKNPERVATQADPEASAAASDSAFPQPTLESWPPARPLTSREIVPHQASRRGELEAAERLLQAEVARLSAQRTRLTELGRMSGSLREKIKQREEYLQKLKAHRETLKAEQVALREELEAVHQQTLAAREERRLATQSSAQSGTQGSRVLKISLLALVIVLSVLGVVRWRNIVTESSLPVNVPVVSPILPQSGLYDGVASVADALQLRSTEQMSLPSNLSSNMPSNRPAPARLKEQP